MNQPALKPWPADKVTRRSVAELVPYARNARLHSDAQVAQIAASIGEWGWTMPVLLDEAGGIIAGHGRVLAAKKLGIDAVPVHGRQGLERRAEARLCHRRQQDRRQRDLERGLVEDRVRGARGPEFRSRPHRLFGRGGSPCPTGRADRLTCAQ